MPGPDLGRSWGMVRWLVVCAILLIPAVAHATTPARGAIHYYSALAGRFAFVQPDGSLTVLDSATGKVLFHGEGRLDEQLLRDAARPRRALLPMEAPRP
jgi:hypothetical protein